MPVKIRIMTDSEFEFFRQWSVENHAKELMEERGLTWEEAVKETEEEIAQMLPNGLDTAHNDLMTIAEVSGDESVGVIWTLREETLGRKQSFLCDFVIWDTNRHQLRFCSSFSELKIATLQILATICNVAINVLYFRVPLHMRNSIV